MVKVLKSKLFAILAASLTVIAVTVVTPASWFLLIGHPTVPKSLK